MISNNLKDSLRKNWLLYLEADVLYKVFYKKQFIGKIKIIDEDILWINAPSLSLKDSFIPKTLLATYIVCPDDIEFVKTGEKYYFVTFNYLNFAFKVLETEDTGRDIDIDRKNAGNYFSSEEYSVSDVERKIFGVLHSSMPNIIKSICNKRKETDNV